MVLSAAETEAASASWWQESIDGDQKKSAVYSQMLNEFESNWLSSKFKSLSPNSASPQSATINNNNNNNFSEWNHPLWNYLSFSKDNFNDSNDSNLDDFDWISGFSYPPFYDYNDNNHYVPHNNGNKHGGADSATQCLNLEFNTVVYLMPAISIFGLLGNALAFIVCCAPNIRRKPATLHLACLAACDSLYLALSISLWVALRHGIIIKQQSVAACRLVTYFGYTFSTLAPWCLLAFNVERYTALTSPLHFNQSILLNNRRFVLAAFLVIAFVVNLPFTWMLDVGEDFGCEIYRYRQEYVALNLIHTVLVGLLPCCAIVTLNGLSVRTLAKRRRLSLLDDNSIRQHEQRRQILLCNNNSKSSSNDALRRQRHRSINQGRQIRVVLLVSSVFTVLTLPSYIMRFKSILMSLIATSNDHINQDVANHVAVDITSSSSTMISPKPTSSARHHQRTEIDECVETIAYIFWYTNFAINFILYNVSSQEFRKECCRLCSTFKDILLGRRESTLYNNYTSALYSAMASTLLSTLQLREHNINQQHHHHHDDGHHGDAFRPCCIASNNATSTIVDDDESSPSSPCTDRGEHAEMINNNVDKQQQHVEDDDNDDRRVKIVIKCHSKTQITISKKCSKNSNHHRRRRQDHKKNLKQKSCSLDLQTANQTTMTTIGANKDNYCRYYSDVSQV